MKYKVYVDFTGDLPRRPYYCGKGDDARVLNLLRNKRHTNTANKHGIDRVIVFETDDEVDAFAKEIEMIAEHHTYVNDPFYNGLGCNYTKGGEGISGHHHSETTIQSIKRKCQGRKHTPEEIARQIRAQTGRVMPLEERRTRSANRQDKKPVTQFTLTGVTVMQHESLKSAARTLGNGAHQATISQCCHGLISAAYGFTWRFT